MEKHIQTIFLSVLIAMMTGIGSVSLATYRQIGVMQYQIDEFSKKSDGYITRAEADARAQRRDDQVSAIKADLSGLDARVTNLETHKH